MNKKFLLKTGIFLVVTGIILASLQSLRVFKVFKTSISEAQEKNEKNDDENQMELFQANKNILEEIKNERKKLEEKRSLIKEEEYRVGEAKKEVEVKLAAVKKTEKYILDLLETQKIKDKENLEGLTQLYEGMKPKEAAKVFANMSNNMVSEILQVMPKRKAAKIMNVMKVKQAADVTRILRTKNSPIDIKGR